MIDLHCDELKPTKGTVVRFRCTPEEKMQIHDMAILHRTNVSDLVRDALLNNSQKLPSRDLLTEILRQLNSIGNDINQTVKSLHEAEKRANWPTQVEILRSAKNLIEAYLSQHQTIVDQVREAMRKK